MKTIALYSLALLGLFGTVALADPIVIDGCEVVQADNGNYFYKVDATCKFDRTGLGEQSDGKLNPVNPVSN